MRAKNKSAEPQVFPAVYYATDSHGTTFFSKMRRHVSCAVIATYPAHPEHVFCGQIVKAVAGGRSASFASDEKIAHKSAAHAAKHFRATDVEVRPAIRAADSAVLSEAGGEFFYDATPSNGDKNLSEAAGL